MKIVDIVEKIEGEARLILDFEDGIVAYNKIEFLNFRGFEYILKDKPLLDALIFTPRVCGICNQAHLYATVKALEDIYTKNGAELQISNKAKTLRELGLGLEIISSHIRWYYFFLMSELTKNSSLNKEYKPLIGKKWKKAQELSSNILKALAIFAGQWPHSSYMNVGGVVCDITLSELTFIINTLKDIEEFFYEDFFGVIKSDFLNLKENNFQALIAGDLKDFFEITNELNFFDSGSGFDRFLTLGDNLDFNIGKIKSNKNFKISYNEISESDEFCFKVNTPKNEKEFGWAKRAMYKNEVYETGSFARAMNSNNDFIKSLHKTYKDKAFVRVISRVNEIIYVVNSLLKSLNEIDIKEPSFIKPSINIKSFDKTSSMGVVEAARGSLVHKIDSNKGIIKHYDIITPTVWNLSCGDKHNLGVAQKAIIGTKSKEEAEYILRSFDVCSVCTTH